MSIKAAQPDPIIEELIRRLRDRSEVGQRKYGVTLARTDIDLKGWLCHALEETLDQAAYLARAMHEIESQEVKP